MKRFEMINLKMSNSNLTKSWKFIFQKKPIPVYSLARVVNIPLSTLYEMKRIDAIIKPFKLEDVEEALTEVGIVGMTVTEVKGCGRQKGHTEIYRGAEYTVSFVPKIKIEVAVSDGQVNAAIDAIKTAANTNKIGDGKIFVTDLSQAVRIRTGETDEDAL